MKRLLLFLVVLVLVGCGPSTTHPGFIADLISIRNDDQISGSFVLGTGSIDQTEYVFAFMKKYGMEPITRLKVPMRKCRFYEDGGDNPYVQQWIQKQPGFYDKILYYDFHIPEDTILKKMELR